MTIKELIEELYKYNQDMNVYYEEYDDGGCNELLVTDVDISKHNEFSIVLASYEKPL